jgi:hypothetical protein
MVERRDWSNLVTAGQGRYTMLLFTLLLVFAISSFVSGAVWVRWMLGGAFAESAGDAPLDVQLTYFSLVTLTTIGYGDITRVSSQVRILSALEGLIGQLFLAIIIARLVALEISSRMQPRS